MDGLAICDIIKLEGRLYMFVGTDDNCRYATLVDIQDMAQIDINMIGCEYEYVGQAKISVK